MFHKLHYMYQKLGHWFPCRNNQCICRWFPKVYYMEQKRGYWFPAWFLKVDPTTMVSSRLHYIFLEKQSNKLLHFSRTEFPILLANFELWEREYKKTNIYCKF